MDAKTVLNKVKKFVIGFFKDDEPKQQEDGATKRKSSVSRIVFTAIGIAICVVLIPILAINITLSVKGKQNPDKAAGVFGYIPVIVLSGSMERKDDLPEIKEGDLIFLKEVDTAHIRNEDIEIEPMGNESDNQYKPVYENGKVVLKEGAKAWEDDDIVFVPGDVIAFVNRDSLGNIIPDDDGNTTYVTHRIIAIAKNKLDGSIEFKTAGDYTGSEDSLQVPIEDVVGWYNTGREPDEGWVAGDEAEYEGARMAGVGSFISWVATPVGIAVVICVPVVLFVLYDILRRQIIAKRALKAQLARQAENGGRPISSMDLDGSAETAALKAEIEALKKEQAEAAAKAAEPSEAEKLRAELEMLRREKAEAEKAEAEKEDN